MFENFSNVIFIAVALAIFIGRTVAQARKKQKEPPPPPPKAPVLHFEDDDDDIPGYLKKPAPKKQPVKQPVKKQTSSLLGKAAAIKKDKDTSPPVPVTADRLFPARAAPLAGAASQGQEGFTFDLGHLSPMKQAIVMAEILGPPKALRD